MDPVPEVEGVAVEPVDEEVLPAGVLDVVKDTLLVDPVGEDNVDGVEVSPLDVVELA